MSHQISQHAVNDALPGHIGLIQGDMDVFIQQLMSLMEASQQGYALFDGHDEMRFANSAFRTALGVGPNVFPSWVDLMRSGYQTATGTAIETSDFELWLRSAGLCPFRRRR
ncbi:hypothetical protein KHC17_12835 [Agrobacterium salinitolerans]|uniref:hypothetical protein n=1 Tax=Agrobacterium salinitolerans TaxID=1183413 RepID=UPI001C24F8E5|nr:hypothetical protein [Agrobacterium salinitolerans]QXC51384.1 hypothetical protein KHC17_12835 [Agrobacterium salinitolerans]